MTVKARAFANIAFVKYWGKRDARLVLPHNGSLSVALDFLSTETSLDLLSRSADRDELTIDGVAATERERARTSAFLDAAFGNDRARACIVSQNSFPTAAGLASSASGFAALALAAAEAYGVPASVDRSALARLGSGSAARSIPGGWAEWRRGEQDDGGDSLAVQIAPPSHWDVRLIVALTMMGRKEISSRDAMARSVETSPYYDGWRQSSPRDLEGARSAVLARDLRALGEIAEHSCLKMHALANTARPPAIFFEPATLAAWRAIQGLRAQGTPVYATVDAGPHLVALCAAADAERVERQLSATPGVVRTICCAPAGAAEVLA